MASNTILSYWEMESDGETDADDEFAEFRSTKSHLSPPPPPESPWVSASPVDEIGDHFELATSSDPEHLTEETTEGPLPSTSAANGNTPNLPAVSASSPSTSRSRLYPPLPVHAPIFVRVDTEKREERPHIPTEPASVEAPSSQSSEDSFVRVEPQDAEIRAHTPTERSTSHQTQSTEPADEGEESAGSATVKEEPQDAQIPSQATAGPSSSQGPQAARSSDDSATPPAPTSVKVEPEDEEVYSQTPTEPAYSQETEPAEDQGSSTGPPRAQSLRAQATAPQDGSGNVFNLPRPLERASTVPLVEKKSADTLRYFEFFPYTDLLHEFATFDIPAAAWWWICIQLADGTLTASDLDFETLDMLQGTNVDVMKKIPGIFRDKFLHAPIAFTEQDRRVWILLDEERAASEEGLHRGVGCHEGSSTYKDKKDRETYFPPYWYGGRVEFRTRIYKDEEQGTFRIKLLPPKWAKSNQMSRLLGSENRILVRSSRARGFEKDEVGFLKSHHLVLLGHAYTLFCPKDDVAYFLRFKDSVTNISKDPARTPPYTFTQLLALVNNPAQNDTQIVSKYINRNELQFSGSVPVFRVEIENIKVIEDDVAESPGEQGPRHIKTDGHGWCNLVALRMVSQALGMPKVTTIQGRIYGAKGLWSLHPDREHWIDEGPPKIWIRESQLKVQLGDEDHATHLTFNLVRIPSVSPVHLFRQVLLNLSLGHNVPNSVLVDLMKESMIRKIEPLVTFDHPTSRLACVQWLERMVTMKRLRRLTGPLSRALGYSYMDIEAPEGETLNLGSQSNQRGANEDGDDLDYDLWVDEEPPPDEQRVINLPTAVECDSVSGFPLSMEEFLIGMFGAGFNPQRQIAMQRNLDVLLDFEVKKAIHAYDISMENAIQAWIIPDPYGILEPGEIYIRTIGRSFPGDIVETDVLEGDVLLWRTPLRFGSDMQKCRAVNRPQLSMWPNVIIMSRKGNESAAFVLSGGDFDGDAVYCCWDQRLLQHFEASPSVEPPDLSSSFKGAIPKVKKFLSDMSGMEEPEKIVRFVRAIADYGFAESRIGFYSNAHEKAILKYGGYNEDETIRLGLLCNAELDSRKHGKRVLDRIYMRDVTKYAETPYCLRKPEYQMNNHDQACVDIARAVASGNTPQELERFLVLDVLRYAAREETSRIKQQWREYCQVDDMDDPDAYLDHELILFYRMKMATANAPRRSTHGEPEPGSLTLAQELAAMQDHALRLYEQYMTLARKLATKVAAEKISDVQFHQEVQKLAEEFNTSGPMEDPQNLSRHEAEMFIAECAYQLVYNVGAISDDRTRLRWEYPFRMAFTTLTNIKAKAGGRLYSSVAQEFAQCMTMHSKLVDARAKQFEEMS